MRTMPFNISINSLDDRQSARSAYLLRNEKQTEVRDRSDGCTTLQVSASGKVKWVITLRVGSANTSAWGRMTPRNSWCSCSESKSNEKDLRALLDHKLNINQQRAFSLLCSIRRAVSRQKGCDTPPLTSPGEALLECWVQSWAPTSRRHMGILK